MYLRTYTYVYTKLFFNFLWTINKAENFIGPEVESRQIDDYFIIVEINHLKVKKTSTACLGGLRGIPSVHFGKSPGFEARSGELFTKFIVYNLKNN